MYQVEVHQEVCPLSYILSPLDGVLLSHLLHEKEVERPCTNNSGFIETSSYFLGNDIETYPVQYGDCSFGQSLCNYTQFCTDYDAEDWRQIGDHAECPGKTGRYNSFSVLVSPLLHISHVTCLTFEYTQEIPGTLSVYLATRILLFSVMTEEVNEIPDFISHKIELSNTTGKLAFRARSADTNNKVQLRGVKLQPGSCTGPGYFAYVIYPTIKATMTTTLAQSTGSQTGCLEFFFITCGRECRLLVSIQSLDGNRRAVMFENVPTDKSSGVVAVDSVRYTTQPSPSACPLAPQHALPRDDDVIWSLPLSSTQRLSGDISTVTESAVDNPRTTVTFRQSGLSSLVDVTAVLRSQSGFSSSATKATNGYIYKYSVLIYELIKTWKGSTEGDEASTRCAVAKMSQYPVYDVSRPEEGVVRKIPSRAFTSLSEDNDNVLPGETVGNTQPLVFTATGWNDVSWHNPSMITPNLDKYARTGVILNSSYIQYFCSPSRSAFMTGYFPYHTGLQHKVIIEGQPRFVPTNFKMLPAHLKTAGYMTHIVGKILIILLIFVSFQYLFTDQTIKVIENHDKSKPLFLYLPFQLVHYPLQNGGSVPHGGNNWPLRGGKTTFWEGGTRGVAFVWSRNLLERTGYTNHEMIHAVDWFPTILHLAGLRPDSNIDGVNQWEMLRTGAPSSRTEFVYNIDTIMNSSAIRYGDYKLLTGSPGSINDWYPIPTQDNTISRTKEATWKPQLYNIRNDPQERNDLAQKQPQILKFMMNRLSRWMASGVKPQTSPVDPRSNPRNWGGVWTPGWC
ncbi:hypothetical protein C0Q70_05123 [Pomacea canaliculata]|uniref:Sulfatase N-terminal domain-containing protein n=1 Tax=Pomacea canaliculata TaxID=400727 RepID=A0A2T7PK99_POMCA|nr:hypothetical protein C0Q70_05123 [Pomacea canaliculata]